MGFWICRFWNVTVRTFLGNIRGGSTTAAVYDRRRTTRIPRKRSERPCRAIDRSVGSRLRTTRQRRRTTSRFVFCSMSRCCCCRGRTVSTDRAATRGDQGHGGRGRGWQKNFVERIRRKWRRNVVVRLFSGQIRILRPRTAKNNVAGASVDGARRAGWVYVETWAKFFFLLG